MPSSWGRWSPSCARPRPGQFGTALEPTPPGDCWSSSITTTTGCLLPSSRPATRPTGRPACSPQAGQPPGLRRLPRPRTCLASSTRSAAAPFIGKTPHEGQCRGERPGQDWELVRPPYCHPDHRRGRQRRLRAWVARRVTDHPGSQACPIDQDCSGQRTQLGTAKGLVNGADQDPFRRA
jgi:hypothetical protein